MILDYCVPAVYDGKVLVPDEPVDLQTGRKYLLIVEDITPDNSQKIVNSKKKDMSENALMSESSLAREWLTPEEDEAWDYL